MSGLTSGVATGVASTLQASDVGLNNTRGGWATAFGQTVNVYRLSATTPATGILNDTPILSPFPVEFVVESGSGPEDEIFNLITFVATCDNTLLQLGDIMQETGYRSTGAVYCFTQYRALRESEAIRCETQAIIRRPVDVTSTLTQPLSQWTAVTSQQAEVTEATGNVLVLNAGVFSFATPSGNTPVSVPFGLQPTTRIAGPHKENDPTSTDVQRFAGYLPPMYGAGGNPIVFLANDEIEVQDGTGAVYVVKESFSSTPTGVVGSILLLTRQGA